MRGFSENITIRRRAFIQEGEESAVLYSEIRDMYLHFQNMDKDSLMAESKQLRKAFISEFDIPLKALGLKKKGNVWTMSGGAHIFDLQKSMMSGDKYYFNLNGYRVQVPEYPEPVDWQLIDRDDLSNFISDIVDKIKTYMIY